MFIINVNEMITLLVFYSIVLNHELLSWVIMLFTVTVYIVDTVGKERVFLPLYY